MIVSPQLLKPAEPGGDADGLRVDEAATTRPRRVGRTASARPRRRRLDCADDRGDVSGVEILFSVVFLIALFLFICQVVVWWHTRNILEQAAAEGARAAAAADGSCEAATPAATRLAERIGGSWVESITVSCVPGTLVVVVVTAETPMFGAPGSMHVSARATAPSEVGL